LESYPSRVGTVSARVFGPVKHWVTFPAMKKILNVVANRTE
jgi:hypothetical protein